MQPNQKIRVSEFISISCGICYHACQTIKTLHKNNIHVDYKLDNSPVTNIDLQVQALIFSGFKSWFPNIEIVGEESTTEVHCQQNIDFKSLNRNLIKLDQLACEEINLAGATLFIDPIDGTRSLVQGKLEEPVVLIGLAVNGRASIGLIGHPFLKKLNDAGDYQSVIQFGGDMFKNCSFLLDLTEISSKIHGKDNAEISEVLFKPQDHQEIVIFAKQPQYEMMQKQLDQISPSKVLPNVEGIGNKLTKLIYGDAHVYVNLRPNSYLWDICAGAAIYRAYGGQIVDIHGNEIVYDKNHISNSKGLVASLNKEVLEKILSVTKTLQVMKE